LSSGACPDCHRGCSDLLAPMKAKIAPAQARRGDAIHRAAARLE
jgi:hypothetical protein